MDPQVYWPSISDLAVLARTGKDWDGWFRLLDKEGAQRLEHKAIVRLLWTRHGIGPWWRQMVAVEYERTRGLRRKHQTANGFSVSVSRSLRAARPAVFAAAADARQRRRWFPPGEVKVSALTPNKWFHAAWNEARLEIGFSDRPSGKTQIVVQLSRLADPDTVERERAAWKNALQLLESQLTS